MRFHYCDAVLLQIGVFDESPVRKQNFGGGLEFNSISVLKFTFDLRNDARDSYCMKDTKKENKNLNEFMDPVLKIHVLKKALIPVIAWSYQWNAGVRPHNRCSVNIFCVIERMIKF